MDSKFMADIDGDKNMRVVKVKPPWTRILTKKEIRRRRQRYKSGKRSKPISRNPQPVALTLLKKTKLCLNLHTMICKVQLFLK
jgi:hypothetical protein